MQPNLIPINVYSHGSYFGDSDMLSYDAGVKLEKGRELAAFGERKNTQIFTMTFKIVKLIKSRFPEIYREMSELAILRYRNHQQLIE